VVVGGDAEHHRGERCWAPRPSASTPPPASVLWRCGTGTGVDLFLPGLRRGIGLRTCSVEIPTAGGQKDASHASPKDSRETEALFPSACAWVASQGGIFIWPEPFPLFRVWDAVGSGLKQGFSCCGCCRVEGSGQLLRSVSSDVGPACIAPLPLPTARSSFSVLCFRFQCRRRREFAFKPAFWQTRTLLRGALLQGNGKVLCESECIFVTVLGWDPSSLHLSHLGRASFQPHLRSQVFIYVQGRISTFNAVSLLSWLGIRER